MKFNKVLNDVNVSFETKRYVNNYINESIKLMNESGKIEEFIWTPTWTFDRYQDEIQELLEKNVITFGNENESGILIPVSKNYHGTETDGIVVLKYMLSDRVLLENGFKTPKLKEERNV